MYKLAMALAPLAALAQVADAQQGRGRTEPVVQVHEREVRDVDGGGVSTADSQGLGQPGPRNVLGKIILVPTPQPMRRAHAIGRDGVTVLSGSSGSSAAGSGSESLARLASRNAIEPSPGSGPAISGRSGGKLANAGERSTIGGGGHPPSSFRRFGERSGSSASTSTTSSFRALGGDDRSAIGGGSSSGAFRRFGGEGRSAVGGGAASGDAFRALARQPLAGSSEDLVLGGSTGEPYAVQLFGRSGTAYALALSPVAPNTDPYVFLARGYLFGEDPNETPRSIFLRVPAGMRVVLIPLQGA